MKIFSATLKGTTTVSQGTTNLSGSFTGSFSGSLAGIAGDVSDYSSSVALRTTTLEAASGSFSTRTTNIERVYATTGSNTFTGAQVIQGTLTAQTLVVQTVTSSVLFTTGSNKIGSLLSNVQELTGSVGITGSLSVNTNGLFVSSSGNVGIGNVSPTVALDVTGAGKFSGALTVSGAINLSSSAVFPTVGLFNRTSDTTLYMVTAPTGFTLLDNSQNTMYGATPTSHIWNINNSEKMRITVSGSVGIGTTNPTGISSDAKLAVTNGSFIVDTENNGYGGLKIDTDSTGDYNVNIRQGRGGASGGIRFFTNGRPGGGGAFTGTGNERLTILGTGNVGIGTTSPSQKLEVIGTTKLSSAAGNITGINIIPGSVTNTYQTIGESTAPGGVVRFHAGIVTGWANWENYGASYMDFKIEIKGSGTSDTSYTAMQIRPTSDIRMYSLTGTGTRTVVADSNGQLSAPVSDETVKENIRPIGYGVNEIMQMNPVWFEFKEEFKDYGTGRQNGNIAQELEKIIPEAVFLTPQTNKKGIEYGQLHAVYIKAIQEQQAQIDELKAKLQ